MGSVLRPMVKYGPAGGRGHPVRKTETQATMLMARRLGPSGLRSEIASSSSTSTSTTSSALPRALICRERVPKSTTGKYRESGN